MATDMVTSPLTRKGRVVFGIGCGLMTFVIRRFGNLPEGVSLAIIFMNILVPLINRFTKTARYGVAS
jgi:electron transport complex protein RnfD